MSGLKAALLGVTHPHSAAHLRTLQALPEIEAIYLWDESASALEDIRGQQGQKVAGASTRLEDIVGRDDLVGAVLALPNDIAPDACITALQHGQHLMAEKPIGRTAADVERVVRAADAAGRVLSVCYQNRQHPCSIEARNVVRSGMIGTLISLEARMLTTQVRFRNPQHWLFSDARAGGGILSWLGCHYLDMLRYVTGDEVVAVSAEMNTMSGEAIDVEDVITIALRFRSGAIGVMHAGYMLALSGGGYHGSGYDAYLGFRGREGRVYWDPVAKPPRLYAESTRPDWSGAPVREFGFTLRDSPAYGGGNGEVFIRRFLQACQGEGEPPTTGRDALAVARIVDAAYESSRTGRRVMVEPV